MLPDLAPITRKETVAEEKTRLLALGRLAWTQTRHTPRNRESFDLLGFRHVMGTSRHHGFRIVRVPAPKSVRQFYLATQEWLATHRHDPLVLQQTALSQRLRGFYQYFGYGTCLPPPCRGCD